jgi:lipoprotein-releasing system permease protein
VSGVTAVSPQIRGSAFLIRGQAIATVGVFGVLPDKLSAIADVSSAIIAGDAKIPSDGILIGWKLAEDLGLHVGQTILMRSDRQRERSFRINGIFALGIASADRQTVFMNFTTARALFDLASGISRIELKISPVAEAPRISEMLGRATGLKATSWTDENAQLFEALDAQGRTGTIIKVFSLLTIMRASGVRRLFIVQVFVLEGTLIGAVGSISGALLAWAALAPFPPIAQTQSGSLPIDVAQGGFLLAVVLTTLAAAIASILPAQRAARVDPVEAIGQ